MRKTMEDLAAEYVQFVNIPASESSIAAHLAYQRLEEMIKRVGVDHTNTYLNRAREVYRMLVPKE